MDYLPSNSNIHCSAIMQALARSHIFSNTIHQEAGDKLSRATSAQSLLMYQSTSHTTAVYTSCNNAVLHLVRMRSLAPNRKCIPPCRYRNLWRAVSNKIQQDFSITTGSNCAYAKHSIFQIL